MPSATLTPAGAVFYPTWFPTQPGYEFPITASAPTVVGSSPQWGDADDTTYAELETYRLGAYSTFDNAISSQVAAAVLPSLTTGTITGVSHTARVSDPSVALSPFGLQLCDTAGVNLTSYGWGTTYAGATPENQTSSWPSFNLGSDLSALATSLVAGTCAVVAWGIPPNESEPFGGDLRWRHAFPRMYEIAITITWTVIVPRRPYVRTFPRSDRYGPSRRIFPPPETAQTRGRITGHQ